MFIQVNCQFCLWFINIYIASSPLQGILEVKRMANTGHLKLLIIAIMAMALLFSLGEAMNLCHTFDSCEPKGSCQKYCKAGGFAGGNCTPPNICCCYY
ncbi:hypothetical protein Peur_003933 [Populus x canadensis]